MKHSIASVQKKVEEPEGKSNDDVLLPRAKELVKQFDSISVATLQRRLVIGYAHAERILDQLTEKGVLAPADGSKPRKVLK